jgi:hypothetical protein
LDKIEKERNAFANCSDRQLPQVPFSDMQGCALAALTQDVRGSRTAMDDCLFLRFPARPERAKQVAAGFVRLDQTVVIDQPCRFCGVDRRLHGRGTNADSFGHSHQPRTPRWERPRVRLQSVTTSGVHDKNFAEGQPQLGIYSCCALQANYLSLLIIN